MNNFVCKGAAPTHSLLLNQIEAAILFLRFFYILAVELQYKHTVHLITQNGQLYGPFLIYLAYFGHSYSLFWTYVHFGVIVLLEKWFKMKKLILIFNQDEFLIIELFQF